MPRGKTTKSQKTKKTIEPKKNADDSAAVPAPSRGTRSGLRSGPLTDSAQLPRDNPESIIRDGRKSRKVTKAEAEVAPASVRSGTRTSSPIEHPHDVIYKSIETAFAGTDHHSPYAASEDFAGEVQSSSSSDIDPILAFNRNWGYLPPLDPEAVAVIEEVIANPDMAEATARRIGPEKSEFLEGLQFRNVLKLESKSGDARTDQIKRRPLENLTPETDEEREIHGKLWTFDQIKCNAGSNEALFQRTTMMSLIARHWLIYSSNADKKSCLDFSVEEPWTCPPMPTRAYRMRAQYLTMPKPDLAICFNRNVLWPSYLWYSTPRATKRLVCFENLSGAGDVRAFHFLTIEGKKNQVSTEDPTGHHQSLNNASQALHNMYEIFRDAGPQHEEIFFEKVRFFSIVTSTAGLTIRIHRATRDAVDESDVGEPDAGRIIPEYPLRFLHSEYCRIGQAELNRGTVLSTFERLLIGYGVNELFGLIRNAAVDLIAKLAQDSDLAEARTKEDFYRYGQTMITPKSRNWTVSMTPTQHPRNNASLDMLRSEMVTPNPDQASPMLAS